MPPDIEWEFDPVSGDSEYNHDTIDSPLVPRCSLCGNPVHDDNHNLMNSIVVDCLRRMRFGRVDNPTHRRITRANSEP